MAATFRAAPLAFAAALLGACAGTPIDDHFASAQQLAHDRLGTQLRWLTSNEARRQAQADVDALLAQTLAADDAVRIALGHSPSLQALLFDAAAASADATQSARLPNPVFAFERLLRGDGTARELEINRTLSVSVLDLLLWPQRMRRAEAAQQQARLRLAGDVVTSAAAARQAWVRAVAAQQALQYAEQVKLAADAGSELARRMQAAGNFSKLQRAREQAFAADALAQLARAQQAAQSTREALVRALGLNDTQARALTLPPRLPDLPATPLDGPPVTQAALDERIDLRLARAQLDFIAREQGITRVASVVNAFDVGAVRHSETGLAPQRGFELQFPLPVFDFGDAARSRAQAATQAAVNRLAQLAVDAASQVRESHGAYLTSYGLARHYRDEVLPLRQTIAEENLLRYNGMLIGVFELLADSREQITGVMEAIAAQRDFWLADAALQAALIGAPRTQTTESP